MQFDGITKLHRKSGFGLHQLRNRFRGCYLYRYNLGWFSLGELTFI
jgi:hypothetical protein